MTAQVLEWNNLFKKSQFACLDKRQDVSLYLKESRYENTLKTAHPERRKEFILGRICASRAYYEVERENLLELISNEDRSPAWPSSVVGSISHSKEWVGAAVAKASDLIGLGIDFETIGRAKPEISSHIKTEEDLKNHPDLSEEELLTLIFSSKESLYKALHPIIKKFFGFQDAAVKEINVENGSFVIVLLTDLSDNFGPKTRHEFHGRFAVYAETCLTVLEIA